MTHPGHWSFEWIDYHRRPVVTPNPDFPLGKPVDISSGIGQSCNGDLPWPATGCGLLDGTSPPRPRRQTRKGRGQ